VNVIPAMTE
jgi:hypothetical protein